MGFWIVKSTTVWVQGKYSPTHATNGLAVTKQVAVGGSFLKGHHLIVGEEHATWDGQQILTTFPSQFRDPEGLVTIVYNNVGQLLQPGREGQCGNFNGNPTDDARLLVKARLGMNGVPAEDLIFPGPKTPINQELESCPDAALVSAHEACKKVSQNWWPHMKCLVTVCNGGQAVAEVA